MNKTALIKAVANNTDLPKSTVAKSVDAMLDTIAKTLVDGGEVSFVGFGKFTVQDRAARKGRNPATGKAIDIGATKTLKFKPGKGLKEAIRSAVR